MSSVSEPIDALSDEPVPVTGQPQRTSMRLRFAVAFLVGLVITLALGAGALYAYDQQYTGRVLPGVHVGTVDLSGLTPRTAASRLLETYGGLSAGRVVLDGPNGPEIISYASIGRTLATDELVAEAMAVGRDGTAIDRVVANARTALRGVTIEPRMTFDVDALAARIRRAADGLRVSALEASVAIDDKLAYSVIPARVGRTVDPEPAIADVTATLSSLDAPAEVGAPLPTTSIEPTVTTDEATAAMAAAERITAPITLVVGEKKVTITTKQLRPLVAFESTTDGGYAPVVDTSTVPKLLKTLAPKLNRKAVNASFRMSGSKISAVIPSKEGYTVDPAATTSQVDALLAARATGTASSEIRPALAPTVPVLTTAEAKAAAPKMKMISRWTTYFPIWERNNFGANIWLPALAIDGYVVGPRETFDFWKAVGPISRAKGYGLGGAIINGRTEPQGALAGGICSCSTTLFNAALRAGYKMGARRNHFYYIDRYPLGLDATVFKSGAGSTQTVSWTNDTDYPVIIRGYKIRNGSRGYVRFELFSVPNGRTVTIGRPTVRNVRPASDSVQYTSSLAPGTRKRIESPVDGMQVWRTVTVRDSKGKVIHQTTYYSNYARITGVVLVGR
jgi:vancomycin resistance protein YoaR